MIKIKQKIIFVTAFFCFFVFCAGAAFTQDSQERNKKETEERETRFKWWPTDALPAPVKDELRGGYWWWPNTPGKAGPLWGNRGYCYINKIIFDYKEEELPPPKQQELRPSLLIKKIIKNVKIYFDYNSAVLRDDALSILKNAVRALKSNPESDVLITGNCDIRGSEAYNEKLGRKRGEAVKEYMLNAGIAQERVRIVSRGKLDAIAYITDLEGMQKDRNAQFMVAEVEEVMIPYAGPASTEPVLTSQAQDTAPAAEIPPEAVVVEEGKYLIEKEEAVEGDVKVSTKEYIVQKNDSLWKIAQKELGAGHRWKYLYELNKDRIKNPNKLKPGIKLVIPVE